MRMRMKSKLLYVHMLTAVTTALVVTATTTKKTTTTTTTPTTTTTRHTTGPPGLNLNGKMFTLSQNGGGISFYPPYFSPTSSPWPSSTPYSTRRYTTTRPYHTTTRPYHTTTRPYYTTTRPYHTTTRPYHTTTRPYHTTTRPYYTTTRPYHTTTRPYHTTTRPYHTTTRPYYTTTAPPTSGVSVCLRYLADSISTLFTLSPSGRNPLKLAVSYGYTYTLILYRYSYYSLDMKPNLRFWSNVGPDLWTRVCVTVDSLKNVAQVFSGSNISIRKMLPIQYAWSGEPVIDFSGFDGQVTDVQIWDYPLRYREVFNYMTSGVYGPYRGSALTWSYISYNPRGNTLLEDMYEWQARQPINSFRKRRGRRPKAGRKTNVGERRREQL